MTTEVIAPAQIKSDELFIGLRAYSEAQSEIFFGRDGEIKSLYRLIKANTITILFGKSGTGKTSLLNAGVFPKLREVYCLPFRIRLEFFEDSPDLITQIKQVLKTEIDKYEFHVESYPTTETLWEYFHKEPLWKIITPVLIFDQFEEIFTLANKSSRFKNQELDTLIEELSDLIENSIPDTLKNEFIDGTEDLDFNYDKQKAKIIFSFREDFLAEIESITVKIPSVKNSRFRLLPMRGHQAYHVITKTWKKAIDPAAAHKIVYFLTNEIETDGVEVENKNVKYDIIEVEPSLLSQVCSFIEKERIDEGSDKISIEFLKKHPKNQILRALYNKALQESNEVMKLSDPKNENTNELKDFIEDNLITDEGYRTKYALKKIDERLRVGIDLLKQKYLLREEGTYIELTHDVIVTLVKSDREDRRKKLALERERKKAKTKMRRIVLLVFLLVAGLGGWQYYLITKKANQDKAEAIRETQKIEVKNAALRNDSLRLEQSIDSIRVKRKSTAVSNNRTNYDTLQAQRLSDSITYLNRTLASLYDNSNFYKDSISTLGKAIVDYKNIEKDFNLNLDNLKTEKDNLQIENKKLKEFTRNPNYEIKEKGYIAKLNSLEQRINILQKNRDSLAGLAANFQLNIVEADKLNAVKDKKRIFGYGYDYHRLDLSRKN